MLGFLSGFRVRRHGLNKAIVVVAVKLVSLLAPMNVYKILYCFLTSYILI